MSASRPALGFQLGARLFVFEGYFDHTSFGEGSASRGVLGVRGGLGDKLRLVARAGLGAVNEHGGALTGRVPGTSDRLGGVARAGLALEPRINAAVRMGFQVDAEAFVLPSSLPGGGAVTGSDVFASLRLMLELGI